MKKLLFALVFIVLDLYGQDQTVELCEGDAHAFWYTAIGSPDCSRNWQVFFDGSLIKTSSDEEILIRFDRVGDYRVTLRIENGLCESVEQKYWIRAVECRIPIVVAPTAFTPNQKGLNELYRVRANHVQEISIRIFSRWGELLFASNDQDLGWDGTLGGVPCQDGVYICVVDYRDIFGIPGQKVTTITLYR